MPLAPSSVVLFGTDITPRQLRMWVRRGLVRPACHHANGSYAWDESGIRDVFRVRELQAQKEQARKALTEMKAKRASEVVREGASLGNDVVTLDEVIRIEQALRAAGRLPTVAAR